MQVRKRGWRVAAVAALIALGCAVLSACGTSSTSSNPNTLLKQTFSGSHQITSGNLNLKVTITPTGSSTLHGPITLNFGGPFQSRGKGKLPQSDFSVSLNAQGASASLGVISTGTTGYVTLQGTSYKLPQATFQKVESNFSQVASTSGAGSGGSTLGKFGIQPLNWLTNPTIIGTENVGGTTTTHIRAGVNIPALVNGISQLLQKASSLGVSGTSKYSAGLSPTQKASASSKIENPTFDVWTGNDDKTMRKLQIGATVPVTGQISSAFGGLSSATLGLSVLYSDLNQPQTINTPSNVQPYTQFQTKLLSFVQSLESGLSGTTPGASSSGTAGSAGSGTSGTASTGSSAAVSSYSQCIQAAKGDVTKLQQCGSLLNSSSSSG